MQEKPLGMQVGHMMKSMARVLKLRMAEMTESALTIEQFGLLFAISQKEEEVIQKDMAEFMGKDKSAILRMIDQLEKKELVRRVNDIKDRRKNQIQITEKGEKTIDDCMQIQFNLNKELMKGLTDEEIGCFFKVIRHLQVKAEGL